MLLNQTSDFPGQQVSQSQTVVELYVRIACLLLSYQQAIAVCSICVLQAKIRTCITRLFHMERTLLGKTKVALLHAPPLQRLTQSMSPPLAVFHFQALPVAIAPVCAEASKAASCSSSEAERQLLSDVASKDANTAENTIISLVSIPYVFLTSSQVQIAKPIMLHDAAPVTCTTTSPQC